MDKHNTPLRLTKNPAPQPATAPDRPTQLTEPRTGSSVIFEPQLDTPTPEPDRPKKPRWTDRFKRIDARQRRLLLISTVVLVLLILIITLVVQLTRALRIDYSDAYLTAKELKPAIAAIKNDNDCDRVISSVDNIYVTASVFSGYVEGCQKLGDGTADVLVSSLADTTALQQDQQARTRYDTFKLAYDATVSGSANLSATLKLYTLWHTWLLTESATDEKANDWDWSDLDFQEATKLLENSEVPEFTAYLEGWLPLKQAAVNAYRAYANSIGDAGGEFETLRQQMLDTRAAFTSWKEEHQPLLAYLYPLDVKDPTLLYAKFDELYNYLRQSYQTNYSRDKGGCKETVGQVICD